MLLYYPATPPYHPTPLPDHPTFPPITPLLPDHPTPPVWWLAPPWSPHIPSWSPYISFWSPHIPPWPPHTPWPPHIPPHTPPISPHPPLLCYSLSDDLFPLVKRCTMRCTWRTSEMRERMAWRGLNFLWMVCTTLPSHVSLQRWVWLRLAPRGSRLCWNKEFFCCDRVINVWLQFTIFLIDHIIRSICLLCLAWGMPGLIAWWHSALLRHALLPPRNCSRLIQSSYTLLNDIGLPDLEATGCKGGYLVMFLVSAAMVHIPYTCSLVTNPFLSFFFFFFG